MNTKTCGSKYEGKGKGWAKGGKNVGWTTGRGYVEKPVGAPVRLICVVCRDGIQYKNKRCIVCNKGVSK